MEEEQEFITIDEIDCEATEHESYSPRNISKRKAEENDSEYSVFNGPSRKKRQNLNGHPKASNDAPFISIQFASPAVARQFADELTKFVTELTKTTFSTTVVKNGYSCLDFFKSAEHETDEVEVLEDDGVSLVDLPKYDQTFNGAVGCSVEEKKEAKASRPRNTCFNCEGDHMMSLCPEPRNGERIAKNRRDHQSSNPSYNRYHEEAEQRFGHLQPGTLSDDLRRALGLENKELPAHIYRMRVLGYPPGWLRAARQQRSSIAVLHNPRPEKECPSQKKEAVFYDHSKLVQYPGFNVRDTEAIDLCQRYGFPPMQFHQSLLKMKCDLPTKTQSGPEKAPPVPPCPTAEDMDVVHIDDGDASDPVNDNAAPLKEAGPPTAEGRARGSAETPEEGECVDSDAQLSDEPAAAPGVEQQEDDDDEEEEPPLVRPPEPAAHSTPLTLTPGASRCRELGTPVTSRAASRSLPEADKWAAGITEHLPFENLPGATGAWDRMSDLIKRVRSRISDVSK